MAILPVRLGQGTVLPSAPNVFSDFQNRDVLAAPTEAFKELGYASAESRIEAALESALKDIDAGGTGVNAFDALDDTIIREGASVVKDKLGNVKDMAAGVGKGLFATMLGEKDEATKQFDQAGAEGDKLMGTYVKPVLPATPTEINDLYKYGNVDINQPAENNLKLDEALYPHRQNKLNRLPVTIMI